VRASVVVITKTDFAGLQDVEALKNKIKSINPDAFIFTSVHKPVKLLEFASFERLQMATSQNTELPLESIKGKNIVALCGIGNPDYFMKTLDKLGAVVKAEIAFQDHHPYDFADLEYISKKCQAASTKTIVTTEKDMIKLKPLIQRHALAFESLQIKFSALEIRLGILQDEDKFAELIWK
jgi:tetraacyldisaccharide 4'-kinase